jgi:hypothetical protein
MNRFLKISIEVDCENSCVTVNINALFDSYFVFRIVIKINNFFVIFIIARNGSHLIEVILILKWLIIGLLIRL